LHVLLMVDDTEVPAGPCVAVEAKSCGLDCTALASVTPPVANEDLVATSPTSLTGAARERNTSPPRKRLRGKTPTEPLSHRFRVKERNADFMVVQGFEGDLLNRVNVFLQRKKPQPAKMKNEGGNSDDERKARYDDRDSLVSWFNAEREIPSLHARLAELVAVGNSQWPLLEVGPDGMPKYEHEDTQFAVYGAGQHFKAWHQDAYAEGHDPEDARQFAIVTMLSSKNDYTGGYFQVKLDSMVGKKKRIRSVRLEAGDVVIFPTKKLMHRVSAVSSGVRKTLVFWASDKQSCKYHNPELGT